MQWLEALPAHGVPEEVLRRSSRASLRVEGLGAEPVDALEEDLLALPRHTLTEPFVCEKGWTVPGLRWCGVRLLDVLALAGEIPSSARYVRVGAGDFVYPLSLDEAAGALLCDELDGKPLTPQHGAPWRLVIPGAKCFGSVKWVEWLDVTDEAGANAAAEIALTRIQQPAY